ncbi:la-related protein 6B [Andrographis paniculata]|uniref:la-related protein 6B n=1 Tax=Andrographis paniculata TaxID=175694 RepID=UPI0021E8390A|nr:la-related protein 6B [Andrographis paniculata]
MDQDHPSADSLASPATKKLNAKAPEFVPRSSSSSSAAAAAAPPPPPPLLQPVYARPPSFGPPTYYGYENFYQPGVAPFYGYNVNPVGGVEFSADGNNGGGAPPASKKTGLPDAHQKIINQVEFYFSDINLATTDQLFKFMSKDPDGYVPLSVVASFKKIKSAVSDSTQLANILRSSNKLLVSEDGKKVKRQHPLTESEMEELQSRIIVAENLPEDHSHQNLMKIFSSVGSVKSIRTCPPQNSNAGSSSSSKSGKDGLHSSGKFHAFVEYESVEAAEKAVADLNDEGNWRNCLKVRLLNKSSVKPANTRGKKANREVQLAGGKRDEAVAPEMQGSKDNHSEDALRQSDAQNIEPQMENNAKGNNVHRKGRNSGGGKGKGKGQGRGRAHHPGGHDGNVVGSPPCEAPVGTAKASPVPRMPDGTKGFSMGRGKAVAVKTA